METFLCETCGYSYRKENLYLLDYFDHNPASWVCPECVTRNPTGEKVPELEASFSMAFK